MMLADKLTRLRKKNGWSQEELAEKMQVSRQAVSKWEGAQAVPDLEKILALSRLFGVSTDFLLKDEIEDETWTDDADRAPVQSVSLAQAEAFLAWRKQAARRMALATFLCIVAVIPLLLFGAATEAPGHPVSEPLAAGVGLTVLLVLVAIAVAIFISCGFRNAPFEQLDKEPFETEDGVDERIREEQRAFRPAYARCHIMATCLCILSPIPLFAGIVTESAFFTVALLTVTMLLAGVGAALFILAGVRWASMQKLLKEGDYAPRDRRTNRLRGTVASIYWLSATVVYLGWSFGTKEWESTWVVWPIAGILFAVVMCLCNLWTDRAR